MYKALSYFTDLQDANFEYKAGDKYPRDGYVPTEERVRELSSNRNRRGVPVIAADNATSPNKAAKEEEVNNVPSDFMNPPTEANNDTEEVKPKRKGKAKKDA